MGNICVVKASAGSGKTYRLVYEYIRILIENPISYRNILAVTFTNKATAEMKSRIIEQLFNLTRGQGDYIESLVKDLNIDKRIVEHRAQTALTAILQDYSRFAIMTIDKFFQRIIRSFIHELGVDAGFTLELQTDILLSQAIDKLIDSIREDGQLRNWIINFAEECIDEGKTWNIRKSIKELGKELFNDAYKTFSASISNGTLENVVNCCQEEIDKINNQAKSIASSTIETLSEEQLYINDFCNKSAGAVSYIYKTAKNGVIPYAKRPLKALTDDNEILAKKSNKAGKIEPLIPIIRETLSQLIDIYDSNYEFLNSAVILKKHFRSFALLADLSKQLEEICKEQSIIPISETNSIIRNLIAENDTPFIFEKAGNIFSHFMIDEFQDTSKTQWQNFKPLIDNSLSQSDKSPVLLVGDVKQSIYRWRGGDWRILGEHIAESYNKSLKSETLGTNRRSYGNIVRFNNNLIGNCVIAGNTIIDNLLNSLKKSISQECYSSIQNAIIPPYIDHIQRSHKEVDKGFITITQPNISNISSESSTAEDPYIIRTIKSLQDRGFAAKDITILVRKNYEGVQVAKTILDYKTANPDTKYNFDIITSEAMLLVNAPITGFIISLFQLSYTNNSSIDRAIYNRWLNRNIDQEIPDEEALFINSLRTRSLEEAFEQIILKYNLNHNTTEISYIQALYELIISFSDNKVADIPSFLQWWSENGNKFSVHLPEDNDAINISTIHKAKGLQYNVVILPFCDWTLFNDNRTIIWTQSDKPPFDQLNIIPTHLLKELKESYFTDDYAQAQFLSCIDNINLLYVALTRAVGELHIYISNNENDRISTLINSSFIIQDDDSVNLPTFYSQKIQEGIIGPVSNDLSETFNSTDNRPIGGTITRNNSEITYLFGSPINNLTKPDSEAILATFPVQENKHSLKFKINSQTNIENHGGDSKVPREYGILMHKIFENLTDKDSINQAIRKLVIDGTISVDNEQFMKQKLELLLSNPVVQQWFDNSWSKLITERSIITPDGVRRPDRVLIRGNQAVVIDYKFGQNRPDNYIDDIREYMNVIKEMGYQNVEGYIWYVEQNYIQTISLQ